MAASNLNMQKASGGILNIQPVDGATNTSVTIPESGELATKEYVDNDAGFVANDPRAKTALNADGDAPIYACRAWVNFNGTGTVAIRASGNVSSIMDAGVGSYIVNFTTAMPDENYAISGSAESTNYKMGIYRDSALYPPTLTYCSVLTSASGAQTALGDATSISISINR